VVRTVAHRESDRVGPAFLAVRLRVLGELLFFAAREFVDGEPED
jgi:hypothetical protein